MSPYAIVLGVGATYGVLMTLLIGDEAVVPIALYWLWLLTRRLLGGIES